MQTWQFSADRGGTFTDIFGVSSAGVTRVGKVLSVSDSYEDPIVYGIEQVLGKSVDNWADGEVTEVRFGTTLSTNALLEKKGENFALALTWGFEDLPFLRDPQGYQVVARGSP